jgi:hypothetical protein
MQRWYFGCSFLINYVFLPSTSFLFTICGNVVRSFTHNMYLFVCCLCKHSWIVYTNCALCLQKTIFLCLRKSLHSKKQVNGTFKLKDMNDLISRNVKFASIYGLETWSWFNFVRRKHGIVSNFNQVMPILVSLNMFCETFYIPLLCRFVGVFSVFYLVVQI